MSFDFACSRAHGTKPSVAQAMVTEPADGARLGSGSRRGRENRVHQLLQGAPLSRAQTPQNFVHRL